ncbi:E3 ubiquitin-protein ligase TRIM38-like isoform X1 [Frankliniella occidentalis]|uniref:E3 ubiquitin-protein ligase TRIM38-like isoform X1 n=2 Tax=Frankliniella occidentalis TaxID=133901 RepID=A0A9C6U0F8_FRAOC|nr:E3 ubiquitin-protein ligase TRIM38-like isoform X1 [Frankliniella occidentalis]XP_052120716.1 E3 ubiquitin-protein ligase TRIM38-like isoform X1 [Frankliniella occidentalis]XP_052120717.1 E3 ubiquitin-protein ligase TRIM38-like isoform X1 [Frankliniella occidentalis]XP_052120718.1 E3 ubiquitin-protein ligase TRIM38-like isoform X1 [Frankliniella occidentalis]
MMDVLECEVCLDEFDSSTRKPKLLSCGHTICLMCVEELHRKAAGTQPSNSFLCPKCRRETRSSPNELIDNFYIISMIQDGPKEKPKPTPVRFWCIECNEVADRTCEEKHTICRLQKHRGRELKDAVDLLERSVSVRRRLAEMLREVDQRLNGFLGKQADEFAKHHENTQTSLSLLYDSLELIGPEWEKAYAAIEEARQSCAERLPIDEQSLDFLRSARRCEVTVHGEEGTIWCGDLNLQQREDGDAAAVVLGLLSTMQRAKLIRLKSPPLNAGKESELPGQPESKNLDKLESSSATKFPTSIGLGASTEFDSNTVTALSAIRNNAALQQHHAVPEKVTKDEAFWDSLIDEPLRNPEDGNGTKFEIETIGTLDVTVLSRTTGKRMEKDALLLDCNPAVKMLRGLQCGMDPAWACALLGVLSRQLEALELVDAHEEHLHAVTYMPRLRRLRVQSRDFCPREYNGCPLPGPAKLQDLEVRASR